MGKKRSWFACVKRLFISEAKSKTEKKSKRWRWMFGRFKFRQYPEIAAPQKTLIEATEEQRMRVLAVAVATAAAAEAAVAAANAAAEVVRLTHVPGSLPKQDKNSAAVRIQRTYRGHLARKALNALKGVVKLQAVIRGDIARRRMITKMKVLQSLALTCSRVHQLRTETADESRRSVEKKQIVTPEEIIRLQEMELECKKQRNWGLRILSKEDLEANWLRKQEAVIKRERMKRFSFSHRERRNDQILEVAITNEKQHDKHSSQIGRWTEVARHKKPAAAAADRLNSIVPSKFIIGEANHVGRLKIRSSCDQDSTDGLNSPCSRPRRSFGDIKKTLVVDESSLPNSPVFPTYMAATQSAMAKARSSSTPRQRLALWDTYSGQNTPYKLRLSSWSSFNGEMTSSADSKSGFSQKRYAN